MEQNIELLRRAFNDSNVFRGIEDADLNILIESLEVRRINADEMVISIGEEGIDSCQFDETLKVMLNVLYMTKSGIAMT